MNPPLASLGRRICILGPSNSGKSTLAAALGVQMGLPVIHLDQLHHQPGSDWVPRPADEFTALHDAALAGDEWVIEGNYSRLFAARFARATGIILLDLSTPLSLWRYARRTLFERHSPGVRRYLGADPNEALRGGHAEIIRTLLPAARQKAWA